MTALAKGAEISQSTIRGYVSRKTEPPRDVLVKLAKAAGVSVQWLTTGEGPIEAIPASSIYQSGDTDLDEDTEAIVQAIAKKYSVPLSLARARLARSDEFDALESAMDECRRYQSIPVAGTGRRKVWGVLAHDTIKRAAPDSRPSDLEVYQVQTENLGQQFHIGDWALVDRGKNVEPGTYCVIPKSGQGVEIRDISMKPGMISLSRSRDIEQFGPSYDFSDIASLAQRFEIIGRVVGAIRFVAAQKDVKSRTSPSP